jgi:hypothetical protein
LPIHFGTELVASALRCGCAGTTSATAAAATLSGGSATGGRRAAICRCGDGSLFGSVVFSVEVVVLVVEAVAVEHDGLLRLGLLGAGFGALGAWATIAITVATGATVAVTITTFAAGLG